MCSLFLCVFIPLRLFIYLPRVYTCERMNVFFVRMPFYINFEQLSQRRETMRAAASSVGLKEERV